MVHAIVPSGCSADASSPSRIGCTTATPDEIDDTPVQSTTAPSTTHLALIAFCGSLQLIPHDMDVIPRKITRRSTTRMTNFETIMTSL